MRNWNPDWHEISSDVNLSCLWKNERSLFHNIASKRKLHKLCENNPRLFQNGDQAHVVIDILSILKELDAQISDHFPSSNDFEKEFIRNSDHGNIYPEGFLLADQGTEINYVFLTIRGSLVYFHHKAPHITQKGVIDERKNLSGKADERKLFIEEDVFDRPEILERDIPLLTVNYLYPNCRSHGILGPTQIAGITESWIDAVRFKSYKLQDTWLWSLMATPGSIVVRIPTSKFRSFISPNGRVRRIYRTDLHRLMRLDAYLLIRCIEVVALRLGTQTRSLSLFENGQYDRLLAHFLYEYYRGSRRNTIDLTAWKAGFYLGTSSAVALMQIKKLMKIFGRGGEVLLEKTDNVPYHTQYVLHPQLCLSYYLGGLTEAAFSDEKQ